MVNHLIENMSQGISNFEIERLFKEINNKDLNENILRVSPSDRINKFIMFEKMMSNKKIPLCNLEHRQGKRRWNALMEYFKHFTKK